MTPPHAVVLSGGTIVDGTGSPSYRGDVLIEGHRITGVGMVSTPPGAELVDVSGHMVAPGFIDMHSHSDLALLSGAVRDGDFDLGVAFDGDGDRMLAVDRTGAVVDGDELIALASLHLRAAGRLPGSTRRAIRWYMLSSPRASRSMIVAGSAGA